MIERRPFNELGGEDHGWLKAKHHFSFGEYENATRMGWGSLRVWNDDEIAPNTGFPPHPHANMEIITYVREGAVTHKDSLGNEGRTEAGDVQVMSAGSGIRRIQPRTKANADLPDLDHPKLYWRVARLGVATLPQGRPLRAVRDARERLRQ
jgi:quercetin 2,3-dioxygenase